jgi:hypothetical protein
MTYPKTALTREATIIRKVAEDLATAIDSNPHGDYDAISGVRYRHLVETDVTNDPSYATAEFQVIDGTGEIFIVTVRRDK